MKHEGKHKIMLNDEHHPWGGQISQIRPCVRAAGWGEPDFQWQSAEDCESRIHAAINKNEWDKIDAQFTRMSMKCEEALQVRRARKRYPMCSTCKYHAAGLATATQPIPGNVHGGGKPGTPGVQAALMIESAVSCWEKNVPLYLPESHATWREGTPHRLALAWQITT